MNAAQMAEFMRESLTGARVSGYISLILNAAEDPEAEPGLDIKNLYSAAVMTDKLSLKQWDVLSAIVAEVDETTGCS